MSERQTTDRRLRRFELRGEEPWEWKKLQEDLLLIWKD